MAAATCCGLGQAAAVPDGGGARGLDTPGLCERLLRLATPNAGAAGRKGKTMNADLQHFPPPADAAAAAEAEKLRQEICQMLQRGGVKRRDICRTLRCTAAALNEFLTAPVTMSK